MPDFNNQQCEKLQVLAELISDADGLDGFTEEEQAKVVKIAKDKFFAILEDIDQVYD